MTWICPGRGRPKGRACRCGGGSAATMAASRGDASRVAERPAVRPPSIHHTDASKAPIRLFGRVLDNILGWLLGILERFGSVWEELVRPRNVLFAFKNETSSNIWTSGTIIISPKTSTPKFAPLLFQFWIGFAGCSEFFETTILSSYPFWLSFVAFFFWFPF